MATQAADTDSLEVKLVFQTIACRTCTFFWPLQKSKQPYGPYSTFDFDQNYPIENPSPGGNISSFIWATGKTATSGIPTPEILDGCRKAPIMTIGINPNLTAYFPSPQGAYWTYPAFESANGSDQWAKYASYYRYRSIYQEHFDLEFIEKYVLLDGHIIASADGKVQFATVQGDQPSIKLELSYVDGGSDTLTLDWAHGTPPFVVLKNSFNKGDIIAAKLSVPAGLPVSISRQIVGYYHRFDPILSDFNQFLKNKGYGDANVRMGEDVCQLDMVACASPKWQPEFLGGGTQEKKVISNCVSKNGWVIKQLVQTRPAVLYLIGEASFNMFRNNFGALIKSTTPLPLNPTDGAFTLLRDTTDVANPVTLQYTFTAMGTMYNLSTRIVVSPHFSYSDGFIPQFRLSPQNMEILQNTYADCFNYMARSPNTKNSNTKYNTEYTAFYIQKNVQHTLDYLKANYSQAYSFLIGNYYDTFSMLSGVLKDVYNKGKIAWVMAQGDQTGYLKRNDGPCNFCVNDHWNLPLGCPYKKNLEQPLPKDFLENIVADIIKKGKSPHTMELLSYTERSLYIANGKIVI